MCMITCKNAGINTNIDISIRTPIIYLSQQLYRIASLFMIIICWLCLRDPRANAKKQTQLNFSFFDFCFVVFQTGGLFVTILYWLGTEDRHSIWSPCNLFHGLLWRCFFLGTFISFFFFNAATKPTARREVAERAAEPGTGNPVLAELCCHCGDSFQVEHLFPTKGESRGQRGPYITHWKSHM